MISERSRKGEPAQQMARAESLLRWRELAEARAEFDRAEEAGADANECSAGRWTAAMLAGTFEAAWEESDRIRQRQGEDPHRFWNGEDITGKRLMVRCLHGFGDAIQMLRFLPRLAARAAAVVVEVPPRMLSLAALLDGMGVVTTWGDQAPAIEPSWDLQVEVMELPYLLRIEQGDLPVATNYLRVPREEVLEAERRMGDAASGLRVGLVWGAGEWNQTRSMMLEGFEVLLRNNGAEFWSLQGGVAQEDATEWVRRGRLRDAAMCGDGLRALAAAIANMDLVISVDTLAVHLAGAIGKPAWILLQHAADWRWMVGRCDSPWYPEARLFRQDVAGDWTGVMERVREEMGKLTGTAVGKGSKGCVR